MLEDVFQRLFASYGPQGWWPGDSPLEIIVGAVLTQHTNWRNVEKAINNLKVSGLMSLRRLCDVEPTELAEAIRPAGYFRLKARRLQNLARFIDTAFGSLDDMFRTELTELRRSLLRVNGVGPETADSILLYAGSYPTFVVDAYTARIIKRHGWIGQDATYDELKSFFESQLHPTAERFNEFHALIVRTGKNHCGPRPRCEGCPLQPLLPITGPLEH